MNDRIVLIVVVSAVMVATLVVWDWNGWDRHSLPGEQWFAISALAMVGLTLAVAAGSMVFRKAAPAIAGDRDRKALDALLTTELTSAEIVAGTMAEALLRAANGVAATFPVILFVFRAGVDIRLVVLGMVGIASTALVVAAFSVAASVETPTVNKALALGSCLNLAWLFVPFSLVTFVPLFRLTPPQWLMNIVLLLIDSSPIGLVSAYLPIVPRPGKPHERLMRMIALQLAGALAIGLWAAYRLRPASRSLYDAQGRSVLLRMLRLSNRRLRPRPPCGDDPVYWFESNAGRVHDPLKRLAKLGTELISYGMIAVGMSWFAVPAFAELAERGYGTSREAFSMPELNPLARAMINHFVLPIAGSGKVQSLGEAAPGQARLEFNLALREFSACVVCCYIVNLLSLGTQSVAGERTRDTWLGLLATPLSGRDIVRGKIRGVASRSRSTLWLIVVVWLLALVTGALHPLGFLAACASLVLVGELYAAGGVAQGVWSGVERRPDTPVVFLLRVVTAVAGCILIVFFPSTVCMAVLFTYEDVHAALHGNGFPEFGTGRLSFIGARTVVAASLALIIASAAGTLWLPRKLYRRFDELVGRPIRAQTQPRPFLPDRASPSSPIEVPIPVLPGQ